MENKNEKKTGLDLLREPFLEHQISKLPKPTKEQTEEVKNDYKKGVRCDLCSGWHHPKVVHLDYVGHAALTDRLLDCDSKWNWEPVALNDDGSPKLDTNNGLWIKLTVCGVTRMGYGHPDKKTGGDAIKETIGDALRNAAMRFGAALDLWHKGDLHLSDEEIENKKKSEPTVIDTKKAVDGMKTEMKDETFGTGQYKLKNGYNQGKKLIDQDTSYLKESVEKLSKVNGIFGALKDDYLSMKQYLEKISTKAEPKLDESEKLPF